MPQREREREEREIVRQQLRNRLSLLRRHRRLLCSQLELIRGYLATFMDARAAQLARSEPQGEGGKEGEETALFWRDP